MLFSTHRDPVLFDGERRLLSVVVPPWQRGVVWDDTRCRAFVEGIFLGLGAGNYVVTANDWDTEGRRKPMTGWLIDGQQRLTALHRFVNEDMVIFEDVRFSDLSKSERCRFMRNPFPCRIIPVPETDDAPLRDLYARMNFTCVVPHAPVPLVPAQQNPPTAFKGLSA
jgi:hypothetical protein